VITGRQIRPTCTPVLFRIGGIWANLGPTRFRPGNMDASLPPHRSPGSGHGNSATWHADRSKRDAPAMCGQASRNWCVASLGSFPTGESAFPAPKSTRGRRSPITLARRLSTKGKRESQKKIRTSRKTIPITGLLTRGDNAPYYGKKSSCC
jgi:hypothetical protein